MARKSRAFGPHKSRQGRPSRVELKRRIEVARLDLRALFRSMDRCHFLQRLPLQMHALMELDADLAEALRVLDQPRGRFDFKAMQRDTLASLARIPGTRDRVLNRLTHEATYLHQLRAFTAAVLDGGPVPTDGADAVANMAVIDRVYQAAGLPRRGD